MRFYLFFVLSVLVAGTFLCLAAVSAKRRRSVRGTSLPAPVHLLFVGLVAASFLLFIPLYLSANELKGGRVLEAIPLALHNTIRLFVVDGEMGFVLDHLDKSLPEWFQTLFFYYGALLFLGATLATATFILSLFKSFTARLRLRFSGKKTVCVFSALTDCSLTLAKSVTAGDDALIVFCDADTSAGGNDSAEVLREEAERLGAVCFAHDVLSQILRVLRRSRRIRVFVIGEDEAENAYKALQLIEQVKDRENTELFVFSSGVEAEVLLSHADAGKAIVRRIDLSKTFVFNELYARGETLFTSAAPTEDGKKLIRAVVVGMGTYGTQMLKALSWAGQMDGYRLELHGFDCRIDAEDRFAADAPELMDPAHNGRFDDEGEAQYAIAVHAGLDAESAPFLRTLEELGPATWVFVALDSDVRNIRVATALRAFYLRRGAHPVINAVIRATDKKATLSAATDYSGTPYDITYVGDPGSLYTAEVMVDSPLEAEGLRRHLVWGDEASFWKFDYNRYSSMASSLHAKLKRSLGLPGADLPPEERSERDLWALRRLEHRRWNAYMRAEGWVYSGSVEKSSRNNLAKTHNCLVPFDRLPVKEQEKDDF